MPEYRILIVGAGIAGLAVGRALGAAGFKPEIVERVSAFGAGGTGIYLPANGVRALGVLGLAGPVEARAATIPGQRFSNQHGRLLIDVDLQTIWREVGPCLALARVDLHAVLLDGARDIPIRMGTTPHSIERGPCVRVALSDGSTGEYDLVVGADGIHSSVRRLVGDERAPRPVGQRCWRFVTSCPADLTTWSVLLGRGKSFLTIPIGHGLVYCYADVSLRSDTSSRHLTGLAGVRARFADFASPVPEIIAALDETTPIYEATIEEVAETSWGPGGTVVLIGDAAHAMSPNMAQGASLAFEDALVLADVLKTQPTIDAAVGAFARRRHARAAWVRKQTHRRDRLRGLPGPVRDLLFQTFGQRIFRANYAPLLGPP